MSHLVAAASNAERVRLGNLNRTLFAWMYLGMVPEQLWPDEGPDIGDIDDVCDFILQWYGESASAGLPLDQRVTMPNALERALQKLGGLWDAPDVGLFNVQSQIVHPAQYASNGIQAFFLENQGVTNFGFDPASPEQLYVMGAWRDVDSEPAVRDWRLCEDLIGDVLAWVLLTNFMWLDVDERDTIPIAGNALPSEVDTCLWRRCTMYPSAQAWTNDEKNWLYVPGVGFGVGKFDDDF